MATCDDCGLVYDPETSTDEECPQCAIKEVLADKGMEISALKNQVFKLKLQISKGPIPK
jgi:Zn finger protein HypA/HybF involved in hydrogenase expression